MKHVWADANLVDKNHVVCLLPPKLIRIQGDVIIDAEGAVLKEDSQL